MDLGFFKTVLLTASQRVYLLKSICEKSKKTNESMIFEAYPLKLFLLTDKCLSARHVHVTFTDCEMPKPAHLKHKM